MSEEEKQAKILELENEIQLYDGYITECNNTISGLEKRRTDLDSISSYLDKFVKLIGGVSTKLKLCHDLLSEGLTVDGECISGTAISDYASELSTLSKQYHQIHLDCVNQSIADYQEICNQQDLVTSYKNTKTSLESELQNIRNS